jgi:hypothetical protein
MVEANILDHHPVVEVGEEGLEQWPHHRIQLQKAESAHMQIISGSDKNS